MITKFSSLYAGHVDLADMGQDATPANERRYGNDHLASVFAKTDALARTMDDLGYYALWLAEHHFQHEGYEVIPNLLIHSVHLAHITKRLRFGCGFNITPMWHPLRLAEDFAMVDILTGGRVIFGVGRGYHTREVEMCLRLQRGSSVRGWGLTAWRRGHAAGERGRRAFMLPILYLKCIRIVCSPISNRLTAAAVFVGNGWSWKPLTSPWNGGRIATLLECLTNRDR